MGANIFLVEKTPFQKVCNYNFDSVVSPKTVSYPLNNQGVPEQTAQIRRVFANT